MKQEETMNKEEMTNEQLNDNELEQVSGGLLKVVGGSK